MSNININFNFKGNNILVPATSDMLFAEVALKYLQKIGKSYEGLKFFYNSQELNPATGKTLSEYKLHNMSRIDVVDVSSIIVLSKMVRFVVDGRWTGKWTIINFPVSQTDQFENVIERFKGEYGHSTKGKYLRFFYKNKELFVESGKTVDDYHLDEDAEILCIIGEDENEKIIKLKDEINNLQNKLQKANKTIDQLNQENNLIQKKLSNIKNDYNNNQIQNLNNIIASKQKEIEELKKELDKVSNKNQYVKYEDIRMLQFISGDGIINNYPIKCLISETFAEVEERLYQKFPEFRETNNTFISNGNDIKRFKKISENNIKEGSPIQLIVPA